MGELSVAIEKSYLCGLCFLNILPGIFSGMWPPISMP